MPSEPSSKKSRREEPSAAPSFSGTEEAWDVYRLLVENSYGIPYLTVRGRRGGSAIAAAAFNAITKGVA